jgi:hypothetical protein
MRAPVADLAQRMCGPLTGLVFRGADGGQHNVHVGSYFPMSRRADSLHIFAGQLRYMRLRLPAVRSPVDAVLHYRAVRQLRVEQPGQVD